MRHLKENKIVDISAASEDASFLIANVLDEHPKKVWKAASGTHTTILTIDVSEEISDIAIFGTNATAATVKLSDPNEISWGDSDLWGGDGTETTLLVDGSNQIVDGTSDLVDGTATGVQDVWANTQITTPPVTKYQRSNSEALWLQLGETVYRQSEIELSLASAKNTTLYAGVIHIDLAETYGGRNPKYGARQAPVDTSVSRELSNGSFYYKKRDVYRVFDVDVTMLRSDASDLIKFFEDYGQAPTAWRLTDLDSQDWVVYGRMQEPSESHDTPTRNNVNFRIAEVL